MTFAPHAVVATGGRYAALADFARDHGLTMAEAQRLWHLHRPGQRQRLPNRRPSITLQAGWHSGISEQRFTVTVGFNPETGAVAEVFYADGQREGSAMQHTVQDACVLVSLLLQLGGQPADLAHSLGRLPLPGGEGPASAIGAIVDALEGL